MLIAEYETLRIVDSIGWTIIGCLFLVLLIGGDIVRAWRGDKEE